MTKLWCPLCYKSTFIVDTPAQHHVLKHIRDEHDEPNTNPKDPAHRNFWRKYQDTVWAKRREKLERRLDDDNERMNREWLAFWTDPGREVPRRSADAELQRKWRVHMDVHDDSGSESESDSDGSPPRLEAGVESRDGAWRRMHQTAGDAGQEYRTSAVRSTQTFTYVERMTPGGEHQQAIVGPGERGVMWDSMAARGWRVQRERRGDWDRHADQRASRDESQDLDGTQIDGQPPERNDSVVAGRQQPETLDPKVLEAARILMSIPRLRTLGQRPAIQRKHHTREMEAATALEELQQDQGARGAGSLAPAPPGYADPRLSLFHRANQQGISAGAVRSNGSAITGPGSSKQGRPIGISSGHGADEEGEDGEVD